MRILLFCIFILKLAVMSAQQSPYIVWQRCYGGTYTDVAYKIIATSDGGSLAIGYAASNDSDVVCVYYSNAWVLKLDSVGNIIWQKCLGGSALDIGYDGIELNNGYVILCYAGSNDGDVSFNHGNGDFWVVKLDLNGSIVWEKSFGGSSSDEPHSISVTSDGNFIISGFTLSFDGDVVGHHGTFATDLWVIKIDSLGNLIWQKCLGGSMTDHYGFSAIDSEDNVYVIGKTGSTDGDGTCFTGLYKNIWLVKLDSAGNILWDKCYGGTDLDYVYNIEIEGSKVLICGESASSDYDLPANFGEMDVWVFLTDTAGNKIFSSNYGGSEYDRADQAVFTPNGEIIVAALTHSTDSQVTANHTGGEAWIFQIDSLGNLLWQNSFGGSADEAAFSLYASGNSGIMFAGSTRSNNDGDVSGNHYYPHGAVDYWIVNIDKALSVEENFFNSSVIMYPNPASNSIYIKDTKQTGKQIFIYNLFGDLMLSLESPKEITEADVSRFAKGMYFIRILAGEKLYYYKVVVE